MIHIITDSGRNLSTLATLFGHYVYDGGKRLDTPPLWLGSITSLLSPLGFKEEAVRLLLSRACQRKAFLRHRHGRNTFYEPGPQMRDLIAHVTHRVYRRPPQTWDGQWFIVTYQIPDERRVTRERLRTRLFELGFGHLAHSIWISPYDHRQEMEAFVGQSDLAGQVIWCFTGGFNLAAGEIVQRSWDLAEIAAGYQRFAGELDQMWRSLPGRVDDASAFGLLLQTEIRYLQVARSDPYLPLCLLPRDWPESEVQQAFYRLCDHLEPQARSFYDRVAVYDHRP